MDCSHYWILTTLKAMETLEHLGTDLRSLSAYSNYLFSRKNWKEWRIYLWFLRIVNQSPTSINEAAPSTRTPDKDKPPSTKHLATDHRYDAETQNYAFSVECRWQQVTSRGLSWHSVPLKHRILTTLWPILLLLYERHHKSSSQHVNNFR